MNTLKIALLVCLVFAAVACGESKEEPPVVNAPEPAPVEAPAATPEASASAAIEEMLAVAEAGDWAAYVDRFYGEKDKFSSPLDQAKLVSRFVEKYGAKVTAALKNATGVTPRIEDGKALFEKDGQVIFQLFEDGEGGWKFHL